MPAEVRLATPLLMRACPQHGEQMVSPTRASLTREPDHQLKLRLPRPTPHAWVPHRCESSRSSTSRPKRGIPMRHECAGYRARADLDGAVSRAYRAHSDHSRRGLTPTSPLSHSRRGYLLPTMSISVRGLAGWGSGPLGTGTLRQALAPARQFPFCGVSCAAQSPTRCSSSALTAVRDAKPLPTAPDRTMQAGRPRSGVTPHRTARESELDLTLRANAAASGYAHLLPRSALLG